MFFITSVRIFQYFFLVKILISSLQDFTAPLVTTENGQVRGRVLQTYGINKTVFAYQGIPYAQPPVGLLRFKAPAKAVNWTGILNATDDRSECVQNTNPVTGSEDCLYINVYTPHITGNNLTVMVWIHGGAFIGGNSSYSLFTPDYLLEEDIIYVSLNYRLGVFGFLSTGDVTCSGNWGLKDQVLGLQWVQRNIGYFGGDAKKVTIFGESAGSASVSYLLQSRKTAGLYRSAIMESGVSLCLWSLSRRARTAAFKLGKSLHINTSNSSVLLEGLKKVNYIRLQEMSVTTSLPFLLKNALAGLVYTPVIEPVHDDALFYDNSAELLQNGNFNRVPTIIGINSNEGAALGSLTLIFRTYVFSRYDLNASLLAPVDLNMNTISTAVAGNLVKLYYFGILPASLQSDAVVKFISDDQFNRPVREAVLRQSNYAPVYFYLFSFKGALNANNGTFEGVGHAEELPYVFRQGSPRHLIPAADLITIRRMVKFWTNFAKYSNPTPQQEEVFQNQIWPMVNRNSTGLVYLDIATNLTLRRDPFKSRMEFYEHIYNKYGNAPYDTY